MREEGGSKRGGKSETAGHERDEERAREIEGGRKGID